jgi:hypothetical protein
MLEQQADPLEVDVVLPIAQLQIMVMSLLVASAI